MRDSCQKMKFESRKAAQKEIKIIKTTNEHFRCRTSVRNKDSKKYSTYYCDFCESWHLTTWKKRKGK